MTDYAVARANMVENQLRPNRIDDPGVLRAMGEVPRERFVPDGLRACAYGDEDLPLGDGRFLIEPLAVAKLLQVAEIRPRDLALVVGDVTGYVTALVARLAGSVFAVLPSGASLPAARESLAALAGANVVVGHGAPDQGLPDRAPFDLVVLVGSVPAIPAALLRQLDGGGRLVAVVEHGRSGKVTLARKVGDAIGRTTPFDAQIHRLPGLAPAAAFSF